MELFQGALTNLSSLFRGRERRKRPQSQGKNRAGEADQNGKRKENRLIHQNCKNLKLCMETLCIFF